MRYAAGAGLARLRPQDPWLARGAPAGGAYAARLGLKACRTWLKRWPCKHCSNCSATPACAHLSRLSSAAGLGRVRAAKREGLPVSCDVSANHHPDRRGHRFLRCPLPRLQPPASAIATRSAPRRRHRRRAVLGPYGGDGGRQGRAFAQAQPGAPGLATLLPLTLKWARDQRVPLAEALARVTSGPAAVLRAVAPQAPCAAPAGMLAPGAPADLCLVNLDAEQAPDSTTLPCGSALSRSRV